jgi:hypothetical protein
VLSDFIREGWTEVHTANAVHRAIGKMDNLAERSIAVDMWPGFPLEPCHEKPIFAVGRDHDHMPFFEIAWPSRPYSHIEPASALDGGYGLHGVFVGVVDRCGDGHALDGIL